MARWRVVLVESRVHTCEVEADSAEEAYEVAEEEFPDCSLSDQFNSLERDSVEKMEAVPHA